MAPVDREQALAIQRRAFADLLALLACGSDGGRVIERDGVVAAVVPASPRRSIVNSVIYSDGAALIERLDELAATYEEAGIEAWTVWCPEFDHETIAALERAGHRFDASPAAMVLELDRLEAAPVGDLEWDDRATMATVAALNDEAYGYPPEDGLGRALERSVDGLDLRIYQARADGEPACALATIDHFPAPGAAGPDCGIYFVATPERHRRRGLATRLLTAALLAARERGCVTSSLQASAMGEPIYARLGYRTQFRFQMYERRRPAAP